MRASISLRDEGRPWDGGWVAELQGVMDGRSGWLDVDLETVTTSCSYLFSRRTERECVCAPAPVRTSIPG